MSYYTEPPVLYLVTTTVVRTCSKQQPGQYFRAGAAVTVAFLTYPITYPMQPHRVPEMNLHSGLAAEATWD